MLTFVMPDPLTWQAGFEYGLQALAELKREGRSFVLHLRDSGPSLESAAFAAHQLGLGRSVAYVRDAGRRSAAADAVILPRVYPLEQESLHGLLRAGRTVITSDPGVCFSHERLVTFPRRDWRTLSGLLRGLWLTSY